LIVQQWDNKYFTEYLNRNWLKKFMGTGSNAMIQVREDLTKKPGDSITVAMVNKLVGQAKNYNETLEGQEEDVVQRSQKISVREYSHAVKWPKFEEQRTAIDLRQAHKDVLMDWNMELDRDNTIAALGSIDGVLYASATSTQKNNWTDNNSDRVLFGAAKSNRVAASHSSSLANVDSVNDKLTPAAISLMKRMAKSAAPKIKPFKARGQIGDTDCYPLLVPSLIFRDIRENATFQQANREARERNEGNPLFDSADLIWDNVPIFEVEDIAVISGVGASSIDVAPVYLCGAQCLAQVWAMRPQTVEDTFDYKRKVGLAIKQWYKMEKLRFGTSATTDTGTTRDHGLVTGFFAAVAD
jgi:N4-gp56 family major capsid protein